MNRNAVDRFYSFADEIRAMAGIKRSRIDEFQLRVHGRYKARHVLIQEANFVSNYLQAARKFLMDGKTGLTGYIQELSDYTDAQIEEFKTYQSKFGIDPSGLIQSSTEALFQERRTKFNQRENLGDAQLEVETLQRRLDSHLKDLGIEVHAKLEFHADIAAAARQLYNRSLDIK